MPILMDHSPSAMESPPRKKFKFSLKLKAKRKEKCPENEIENVIEKENEKELNSPSEISDKKEICSPSTTLSTSQTNAMMKDVVNPLPLPYSGLSNLGNTCYMNAVLQVLRYCPQFLNSLRNLKKAYIENFSMDSLRQDGWAPESHSPDFSFSGKHGIIASLDKLTSQMECAEENYRKFGVEANNVSIRSGLTTLAVKPKEFVNAFSGCCPMFSDYQQHDSQEFLRSFLAVLEDECSGFVGGSYVQNGSSTNTFSTMSKVKGGCKYPSTITSKIADIATSPRSLECDEQMKMDEDADFGVGSSVESTLNVVQPQVKTDSGCVKTTFEDINVVKRLFEGTLLLQTCCLNCEEVHQRYEPFQDISVPVRNTRSEPKENKEKNLWSSDEESEESLELAWAISMFASVERLNGDNKYFCEKCARLTEADISTYFEKLPQVFTIHLKRFQTSYGKEGLFSGSWVTKVTKNLRTPCKLSLRKWCSKTCAESDEIYTLFGVVMHNGMSSCSGHYLSYVNVDILNKCANSFASKSGSTVVKESDFPASPFVPSIFKRETLAEGLSDEDLDGSVKDGNMSISSSKVIDSKKNEQICSPSLENESIGEIKQNAENHLGINTDCTEQHNISKDINETRKCQVSPEYKINLRFSEDEDSEEEEDFPRSMDITKFFKPLPRKKSSEMSHDEDAGKTSFDKGSKVKQNNDRVMPTMNKDNNMDINIGKCSAFSVFKKKYGSKTTPSKEVLTRETDNFQCSFESDTKARSLFTSNGFIKDNSKSSSTSTWLKFDDSEVTEITDDEMSCILSSSSSTFSTPYLLFYYRS